MQDCYRDLPRSVSDRANDTGSVIRGAERYCEKRRS